MKNKIYQRYLNIPLANKFSLLSASVIILVILALTLIIRIYFEKTVLEIATDGYIQKFDTVSKNSMQLFEDARQLTNALFIDENIQNWFSISNRHNNSLRIKQELQAEKQLDYIDAVHGASQFSSITAITIDGDIVSTNNIRGNSRRYNTLINEIFLKTYNEQWADLFVDFSNNPGMDGIAYLRPFHDFNTGLICGYVIIEYRSEILEDYFSQLQYGNSGHYIVSDLDGNVKLSSTGDQTILDEPFFIWAKNGQSTGKTFVIGSERYLITTAKIDTLNWIMVGLVPVDSLTVKGNAIIQAIYAFGIMAIMIAIVASHLMAFNLTKTLASLAKAMKRFGEGNFESYVMVKSFDEIGMLSQAFNSMATQIHHLVNQVYREQLDKKKSEFSALQAQINPHFLYNTLNSVCSLIKMNQPDEAYAMVRAIGNFYRTSLHSGNTIIPIRSEVENIQSYLHIQAIRYGKKIGYLLDIEESILDEMIVKFTLQPIVENAIYHGIKQNEDDGVIIIRGWQEGDTIFICVQDNGVGMAQNKVDSLLQTNSSTHELSFGLKSIHMRLALYFGQEYGLKIESSIGKGTIVTASLPTNWNQGELNVDKSPNCR